MATRITIDHRRLTQVNGRPFFLIGARHMPLGGTPELLRAVGFNAFRVTVFGTESGAPEPLPDPGLEGILFWAYIFDRAVCRRAPQYAPELQRLVAETRRHPALLCYENYNEPTLHYRSAQFKVAPEELAQGTTALRALDPDHPIWLVHQCGNTVATLRRFNSCLDITGCNPYPVQPAGMRPHIGVRRDGRMLDCIDQSLHAVGKYTEKMLAVAQGRPVWMLIQALANENWFNPAYTPDMAGQALDPTKILYPTYAQMRFMAFDAIVAGATGLAFSMHRTPAEGDIWLAIRRVVGELRELHDALCAPALPGPPEVEYVDLGFSIWDGVRVLARQAASGEIHLFAVNTAFDPAEAIIRLPAVASRAAVVLGEEREVPLERGALCDRFEPYGVHVYRLAATARS